MKKLLSFLTVVLTVSTIACKKDNAKPVVAENKTPEMKQSVNYNYQEAIKVKRGQ